VQAKPFSSAAAKPNIIQQFFLDAPSQSPLTQEFGGLCVAPHGAAAFARSRDSRNCGQAANGNSAHFAASPAAA
jgi:hypothetical protein